MSDETNTVIRGNKCARIVLCMCELYGLSMAEAADIFYKSDTSLLIEQGVADLHCRSDKYLASLVWDEFRGKD